MKKRDYKKEFCCLMDRTAMRHSKWQVWNDFLYLSAASMADATENAVALSEKAERAQGYFSTMDRYQKEERENFAEMLTLVILALEENPEQDFLGSLYHQLGLHQEQRGQFFTPYHICEFMSEIQFTEQEDAALKEKGFISVSDPACGAGAMLIAFANVAKKHGVNYQKHVLFVAQDIDRTAALMCYIQLSLLGCPAVVIIGDSLVKPGFHPDNDIWYTPFYYLNRWRFQSFFEQSRETECTVQNAGAAMEKAEAKSFMEGAGGQMMPALENAS